MKDKEKNEIYEQARLLAEENTEEGLEKAMQLYKSINGWKDAGRQFINCRTQLGRIKWQRESAVLKEYEKQNEKKINRRRKIFLTSLAAVLLICALIATIALVRFNRYCKASAYYTAGEYNRAADAFMQMGNYRNSKTMVHSSAVGLYKLRKYDEALPYFIWLDGYIDNGYYLRKCLEHVNAE